MSTSEITAVRMTRPLSWVRLLSQCLIAVLLFAALNVYTYRASYFFQRSRAYNAVVSGIAGHNNVRVVFCGDSHFAVPLNEYLNVDPAGSAYSVAGAGDSLRECFAKVRRALETAPTIDTLMLTADPHMFARGRVESSNRSFVDWYFIADRDSSGVQRNLWSALLQQVPLFNEDFLQYFRTDLATVLRHVPRQARAAGDPLDWSRLSEAERMKEAIETGRGDHEGIGEVAAPFMWAGRILDLARAKHIRVIGLRFPVHPGYSAQAPADKVAELDAFLLGHGVTQIIDLRDALTDPRDFEDPDHVNEIGAVPIVKILEQRLQRPLLAAGQQ